MWSISTTTTQTRQVGPMIRALLDREKWSPIAEFRVSEFASGRKSLGEKNLH